MTEAKTKKQGSFKKFSLADPSISQMNARFARIFHLKLFMLGQKGLMLRDWKLDTGYWLCPLKL